VSKVVKSLLSRFRQATQAAEPDESVPAQMFGSRRRKETSEGRRFSSGSAAKQKKIIVERKIKKDFATSP